MPRPPNVQSMSDVPLPSSERRPMKISCPTCAAKYTIADDKARGKSVKIKCKKCGTSIVAGGDEGAAATWSINIAEDDQRSLPIDQIAALQRDGVVTDETFVWREGMADWLPLSAVPELRNALLAAAPAPLDEEDMPTRMGQVPAELLALGRGDAPAPAAAARRAPRAGADLFGGGAPAAAPAPIPDDQVTRVASPADRIRRSAPPPAARAPASVRAPAPAPRGSPSQPVPAALANNEASGLIDIRTLQASLKKGQQSAPDKKKADDKLDDIMSLGVGSPLFAPAPSFAPIDLNAPTPEEPPPPPPPAQMQQGAPVAAQQYAPIPIPEPPPKKKTGLLIGAAVGLLAFLGIAGTAGVMLTKKSHRDEDKLAVSTTSAPDTVAPSDAPVPDPKASAEAPAPDAPPSATVDAPTPDSTDPKKKNDKDKDKKKKKGDKDKPDDSKDDKKDVKNDGKDDKKVAAKEEKKDDPPPATGGGSDAPFDRGAASASLGGIAGGVGSCKKGDGPTGGGRVSVTFASSGAATSVVVDPPFGGTPTGNCIQGRFRGARVPAFGGSPVTVKKSFSVN